MLLKSVGRAFGVGTLCSFMVIFSSSCLVRTRKVVPRGQPSNKPALVASREDLLGRLHRLSDPIQSFNLKVDMAPSVGGVFGGTVTDYPTIQGFILFSKADRIRVLGLDPVVHSTIFDMVSLANDFRVSIPPKNQFIMGTNDAPATSKNKLENMRPVAFMNSLLIDPPRPAELTLLEDTSDETAAGYKLLFVQRNGDDLLLLRSVTFDRYTLDVSRQRTYDKAGNVTSETKYSNWQNYNGVRFPSLIDMARPQEGYALQMTVTDFKLNPPGMSGDKFVLDPPANAQIRSLTPSVK